MSMDFTQAAAFIDPPISAGGLLARLAHQAWRPSGVRRGREGDGVLG